MRRNEGMVSKKFFADLSGACYDTSTYMSKEAYGHVQKSRQVSRNNLRFSVVAAFSYPLFALRERRQILISRRRFHALKKLFLAVFSYCHSAVVITIRLAGITWHGHVFACGAFHARCAWHHCGDNPAYVNDVPDHDRCWPAPIRTIVRPSGTSSRLTCWRRSLHCGLNWPRRNVISRTVHGSSNCSSLRCLGVSRCNVCNSARHLRRPR